MRERKVETVNLYVLYTVLFILIWGIIMLPFVLRGNSLIGGADSFNQFFPVFAYMGKYIREFIGRGRATQFDFRLGLGDNVIGTLNYHGFGDIFSVLSALADGEHTELVYDFVMLLKFYLCGIAFIIYCKKYICDCYYCVASAIMYVFSVYALFWGLNIWIFLNPMITLPLVLYGIDQIWDNVRKASVSMMLSLFVQALNGFYFLYMEIIISILYFLIVAIVRQKKHEVTWKETGIKLVVTAAHGVLGIGMGGVLLIPSIIGFFSSTRANNVESFASLFRLFVFEDYRYYIESFANLFIPNAFASVITIPMIVLLGAIVLVAGKNKKQEIKVLAVFMAIAFWIPATGNIMNGFSYWVDRWYFAVLLFLIIASMAALEEKKILEKRVIIIFEIIVWSSMLVHIFVSEKTVGLILRILWFAVFSLLLPYICNRTAMQGRMILICVVITMIVNGLLVFGPKILGGSGYSAAFKAKGETYQEISNGLKDIENNTGKFERLDIYDSSLSAALVTDYYGTTEYFSMLNTHVSDFFQEMYISPGIRSAANILKGLDGRYELETLLSVVYYMDFVTNEDEETEAVIRNVEHSLPLGFTYSKYIEEEAFEQLDPLEKSSVIVNCLVSDRPIDDLEKMTEEELDSILNRGQNRELDVHVSDKESQIRVNLPEVNDGKEYYAKLSDFCLLDGGTQDFYVGNKNIQIRNREDNYYMGEDEFWVHVTEFEKNEAGYYFDIVPDGEKRYFLGKLQVYEHTPDRYAIDERNAYTVQDMSVETNVIKGKIKVDSPQAVFFSVPYSSGWTAYIDGRETEIIRSNIAFVSLMLDEGEHEILLTYRTPGLITGIIVSIVCWIIFICILMFSHMNKDKALTGKDNI